MSRFEKKMPLVMPAMSVHSTPNSISYITRALRSLPFTDMMVLSEELRERILSGGKTDIAQVGTLRPDTLAKILCSLDGANIELSDQSKQEEKLLCEIFTRKRVIAVTRRSGSWELVCPTLSGSQVLGTELRPMFNHLLDQIVTLHALGRT